MVFYAAVIVALVTGAAPAWNLATPAPEGLMAVGPEEPLDGGGPVQVTLDFAAGVDVQQVATRWREAFVASGWSVLDQSDDGYSIVNAFVRDDDDMRAAFALDRPYAPAGTTVSPPARGRLWLGAARPGPHEPAVAPGCTPIPRRGFGWYVHSSGVDQRGEYSSRSVHHVRHSYPAIDVDGDFVLDWLVPIADAKTACPEDVRWEVWLAAPQASPDGLRCGRAVGSVGPGTLAAETWSAPLVNGLRTLVVERRDSGLSETKDQGVLPELRSDTRIAKFDGREYRQGEAKHTAGICHHCATWTCSPMQTLPEATPPK